MKAVRPRTVSLSRFLSLSVLFCTVLSGAAFAQAQSAGDEKKINDTISKLTLEEKIHMLSGSSMMASTGLQRLGIPAFRMSDGPVGAHIPPPSTAYAAGIGLAASWDRDLAVEIGTQIGRDARSRGASFLLGPGVNIYRAPLNGRNFEYFGEDPFLAGETAVGYIDGVQSQGVSATIKHYAANNSEYFRFTSDSVVSERALREIYLPAFEAAVRKAHVGSIMDSYNLLNGEHATANYHLNVEIAKQQWGFDGVMMSDWTATHDGVAAANGGLDLEMPFGVYMNEKTLLPAVKEGKVKESVIDDKIRRLLRDGYRFGWISHDPLDESIPRYSQQGRIAALQGAREAIVLLKNSASRRQRAGAYILRGECSEGDQRPVGCGRQRSLRPRCSQIVDPGHALRLHAGSGQVCARLDGGDLRQSPVHRHASGNPDGNDRQQRPKHAGQSGYGRDDQFDYSGTVDGLYEHGWPATLQPVDGLLLCPRAGQLCGLC
jgi:beta-glucosidase